MLRKGFTLIELLVVISIIGLLSSVVVASLNSARDKGRMAAGRQFSASLEHAAGDQAVGIWDFDECSGTTTADRSGNGSDGSFVGSPTYEADTPSNRGCSIAFSGSSQYLNMGSSSLFDPTDAVTVSAWVIVSGASMGHDQVVMGKAPLSSSGSGAGSYLLTYGYGNDLYWRVKASDGTFIQPAYVRPSLDEWHHIAATFDGTSSRLFVDGKLASTASVANKQITVSSSNFTVGGNPGLKGSIDEVRIYAKALTASEIGRLYAESASRYRFAGAR